jgi:hypothetical protein
MYAGLDITNSQYEQINVNHCSYTTTSATNQFSVKSREYSLRSTLINAYMARVSLLLSQLNLMRGRTTKFKYVDLQLVSSSVFIQ